MSKIVFNVDSVLPKLQQVNAAIGSKNIMAILADVILKTYMDGDKPAMMCTTSDSENFMSVKCPLVEGEAGVSIAVNAKDFVSTLRNLSGRIITLETDEERHTVKGKYENGHFELPCDNADDFPVANLGVAEKIEKIIDAQTLAEAIVSTECCIGNDGLRPVINGIHFDFFEGETVAVAFDGCRMAKYSNNSITNEQPFSFNLPSKACKLMYSVLQKADGDVKLAYTEHHVTLSRHDFRVIARLYEGKYPPYNQLIMKEYPIEVIVGKDALLGALKVVSPASNAQSQQVVLTFTKGNLTISAEDYEFSKSASVSIPCDHEGKEFKIAFKHGWLAELVSNVIDDNVKLRFTANTKPALVVPETQNDIVEYVYLQMPMMML